jgi:hypothetical protein
MRKFWYILLLVALTGCGPITAEQLRANPSGVHTFKVNADYQAVYQKILLHAQGCSVQGAFGANALVQGYTYLDSKRASISITNSRAIGSSALFTIDIAHVDDNTTEVKVFYAVHRYAPTALLIEDWIKKNSPDCTRGKFVPECAC